MVLKLREIIESEQDLKDLLGIKFPVKVSYKLSRLQAKLAPEVATFSGKRLELAKEFGEELETNNWTIKPENIVAFNTEIEKLGELEVTIDFDKIQIGELGEVAIEPKYLIPFIFE